MPDDRWPRSNPKSDKPTGPPCVKCGNDGSERYLTGMKEVRCVNGRGCAQRVRAKASV